MNILITICARGGSKGIPGKNIRNLDGIPLINYTLDLAKKVQIKYKAVITLSTDDWAIKNAAKNCGITTKYERPFDLATDEAGKIETITHVLEYEEESRNMRFDFILDLDVTSPLRNMEDIDDAFKELMNVPEAKNLFSVNTASKNPYFNMVQQNDEGFYSLVKSNDELNVLTRQSAPKVYDMNASFYWYRRSFFENREKSVITNKSLIFKMNHICFDLDHEVDILFMEFLIKNNHLDFRL
ncbi:acylneuraminate cytidylyltransferase family protein [Schleiferiaceae bacterium]|nr:acylneuraminate cytidylyltransferase family protein [Schleiferiaceae bacterium]